ncbi:MAG: MATE family efflux transporter [Crocinitomicaceae bacterium]|nr:MATE family efflux transporter [Crocinitomicaceae bacterium]|tara:strand:- start:745 stop:2109 length:1365 start_codon:yes stop_codon:yes gene_type:complete
METEKSSYLGTEPIPKLLLKQALPAAIGFMVMSMNMVVDTFFVGQYIGELAIGAISVIFPISFLFSSIGMSIGIGGGSIVSRALGSNNNHKAQLAFNNQISLTIFLAILAIIVGVFFKLPILDVFGAKGDIMPLADTYFSIVLIGIPFLALSMMANNNLRAEGKAKVAMIVLLIPSIVNIFLDYIFIDILDWGMAGAGWATTISYFGSAFYIIYFYVIGKGELKVRTKLLKIDFKIVNETFKIGSVNLVRQGTISLLAIVLNNTLYQYGELKGGIGGEIAISVYGLATRMTMFALFPLIGIAQGFMPIAGYNYGAKMYDRVKSVINYALISGFIIAAIIGVVLMLSADYIPYLFTKDLKLIEHAPNAIFWIFSATPIIVFLLIAPSYYQAIGKAKPALFLTLTKQGIFLIPLVLILPIYYGIDGVWYSFPISDVISAIICFYFLKKSIGKLKLV